MSLFHPGRPKDPPPPTIEEQVRALQLQRLYEIGNDAAYRARVADAQCFARMLDLVEGKVAPNGSKAEP